MINHLFIVFFLLGLVCLLAKSLLLKQENEQFSKLFSIVELASSYGFNKYEIKAIPNDSIIVRETGVSLMYLDSVQNIRDVQDLIDAKGGFLVGFVRLKHVANTEYIPITHPNPTHSVFFKASTYCPLPPLKGVHVSFMPMYIHKFNQFKKINS